MAKLTSKILFSRPISKSNFAVWYNLDWIHRVQNDEQKMCVNYFIITFTHYLEIKRLPFQILRRNTILTALFLYKSVNFTIVFDAKGEQLLPLLCLILLMGIALGLNVPKYVAQLKSCSLKYAVKFQQKCCENKTYSFEPSTSCWCLWTLHKLVGHIDSRA